MQLIRGLHNFKQHHRGCTLTIGNFDGLHLGHQALLRRLKTEAQSLKTKSCMLTFEPLPHEYFSSTHEISRLMNVREKIVLMKQMNHDLCPDYLLVLYFNPALANMSAATFIEEILVNRLAIKSLVIGDDFRFGQGRKGDFELLKSSGNQFGFMTTALETHQVEATRVSSSRVREALREDRLDDVKKMLGRNYQLCGRVAHGDKRGRTIGFPTANIRLHRTLTPLHGVYSVTMQSATLGTIPGVANIGHRPTVNGEQIQLEVHLFNFDKTIYGYNVCVAFHQKIRNEQKFGSLEELKQQINIDCEKAKNFHRLNR